MPVLSLSSLLWTKEIEAQNGCTTCTWLVNWKREPGFDSSLSGSGPTLGHYATLFPFFFLLVLLLPFPTPCCDSVSVPVVTPGLSNLFMRLLPQQDTEHSESWSGLLSTKTYVSLCTSSAPGLCEIRAI